MPIHLIINIMTVFKSQYSFFLQPKSRTIEYIMSEQDLNEMMDTEQKSFYLKYIFIIFAVNSMHIIPYQCKLKLK